ncbi:MAG: methyltransferase domain-containing protein [Planctomycetes bacterium]|nr:methyltransferase domain-containing protein [Planctomycetota bacterium]
MKSCRFCRAPLVTSFIDLGLSPLSNAFVQSERATSPDAYYPLQAYVCDECLLVQLEEFQSPTEIFTDYVYFSSYSSSWLRHATAFCDAIIPRLGLGADSFVMELASNDGYLLRNVVDRGIRCLGIEPAANVAAVAMQQGVPTEAVFFGTESAKQLVAQHGQADLIVANNVLAHVPDINDFTAGIALALRSGGTVSIEFPHLLKLIENVQFDTIYHEHYSYLSLAFIDRLFAAHGLAVWDVEELPTHGGSLRILGRHAADPRGTTSAVESVRAAERQAGMLEVSAYRTFTPRVLAVKRDILRFLLDAQAAGKTVAAYGAAAKGNTLLNFCGIRSDLVEFVADLNPHKQHRLLPGSRIPVMPPERIAERRPDYVLVLPWNLREEIADQLAFIRDWDGRFVTAIPNLRVF